MQRNTGYFPTESLEPCGNRLFSRSALNEGDLFRGSLKTDKPLRGMPGLPLRSDAVETGLAVYALGYPGAADDFSREFATGVDSITVTDGKAGRRVFKPRGRSRRTRPSAPATPAGRLWMRAAGLSGSIRL